MVAAFAPMPASSERCTVQRSAAMPHTSGAASSFNAKFRDHHRFDDRSQKSRVLVCLLVGYKPELWKHTMPALKAALPKCDVCAVTPGIRHDDLRRHCRKEGWSYLGTATPDYSLAQNLCYRLHPAADMIVRVDEDMFLLPNTIKTLLAQYARIKKEGSVDPGFVSPIVPVNGTCYRPLLEMLGLLGEFEARFGKARSAHSGMAIHDNPEAALWVWTKTAPLAQTAKKLRKLGPQSLPCSIQLNIGMIAFERAFWREIGYFPVNRRRLKAGFSTQGADEEYICSKALARSRPGLITTASLAGHFAFRAQYHAMVAELERTPRLFSS